MFRFESDYTEGAIPEILARLSETNFEQTAGYGEDAHTERAKALIRKACEAPDASVWLLVGGTQANRTVITQLLRPHQGVLCADCGHIGIHESGAIEASGHKVLPLPSDQGRVTADQIEEAYTAHITNADADHMVQPGMVYLSHPSEFGTLYTKEEMTAISAVCRRLSLPLYIDGARLGYGLSAAENDLTLPDLAKLADVFTIGGTKVGALFGEAVVFTGDAYCRDFRYLIKQGGGLLAKGRLLGIQFETLFEDENGEEPADAAATRYCRIAAHADRLADRLRKTFAAAGFEDAYPSGTDQIFVKALDEKLESLKKEFAFSFWEKADESHSLVRFCTSWATREEAVEALENALHH